MAITDKEQGVWNVDQVYNKINQGSIWGYDANDPGQLYCWGNNYQGVVGAFPGSAANYSSPTQIGSDNNWKEYEGACSQSHAIKTDGTWWSWGDALWGRLGQGAETPYSSPKQVGTLTTWRSLGTGAQGAMGIIIRNDNTLWSWGYDQYGQLGQNQSSPNKISSPTQIGSDTTWSDEVCNAGSHILAIKTNGTLWAWGMRASGVLGNNQNTSPNPNGLSSPTQIGTDTNWTKACSGGNVSMMIKDDNTLWVWGNNAKGCLGFNAPQTSHRSSPTQLPGTWADCAYIGTAVHGLKTDGTLWSWGAQDAGMLGLNQSATPSDDARSSPCQVGTETTWSNLESGGQMGIVGKTDGTWWVWGYTEYGKLGLNYVADYYYVSSPTQLPGSWNRLNHRPNGCSGITTG